MAFGSWMPPTVAFFLGLKAFSRPLCLAVPTWGLFLPFYSRLMYGVRQQVSPCWKKLHLMRSTHQIRVQVRLCFLVLWQPSFPLMCVNAVQGSPTHPSIFLFAKIINGGRGRQMLLDCGSSGFLFCFSSLQHFVSWLLAPLREPGQEGLKNGGETTLLLIAAWKLLGGQRGGSTCTASANYVWGIWATAWSTQHWQQWLTGSPFCQGSCALSLLLSMEKPFLLPYYCLVV